MGNRLLLGVGGAQAAGAAPPIEPDDLSELTGWGRPEALAALADNDPIGTWADISGLGHDITQATAGKKPLCKTGILNGYRVARYDGSNDVLEGAASSNFIAADEFTVCAVVRASSITLDALPAVYDGHPVLGDDGYWGLYLSTDLGASAYNYDGSVDAPSVALSANTWARLEIRHESGNIYIRKDGAGEVSAASGNTDSLADAFLIGGYSTRFFAGDVAEWLTYSGSKTLTERDGLDDYLATKFAL